MAGQQRPAIRASTNGTRSLDTSTSPVAVSPTTSKARKRRRSHAKPASLSPTERLKEEENELDDGDDLDEDGLGSPQLRTAAGAKKTSCNECRQQKLGCDAQHTPFKPCTRCTKQSLDCRFDANFKRIGKRARQVEIEQENDRLQRQVQDLQAQLSARPASTLPPSANASTPLPGGARSASAAQLSNSAQTPEAYLSPHEGAVESLLHLAQGIEGAGGYRASLSDPAAKRIGDVTLSGEKIQGLFVEYFDKYHHFLPLLNPAKVPEEYYELSPLLFWVVVAVACRQSVTEKRLLFLLARPLTELLHSTLAEVPQNYNVVKAFCLLCTWPLPVSTSSKDPTMTNCGIMMQLAMQIGLHRPSHAQDFSRSRLQLREEDIQDRVLTWAACNVTAQAVSTGYGQPPVTVFDSTLVPQTSREDEAYILPEELRVRVQIERFVCRITESLYLTQGDSQNSGYQRERAMMCRVLSHELAELESSIRASSTPIDHIHLAAAGLHLRLYTFFESSTLATYNEGLMQIYFTTTSFLDALWELERRKGGLGYCTNYVMQMTLVAAFTLLKLMTSMFAGFAIPTEESTPLFARTIAAARQMSVKHNDLPQRVAEVVAQLWKRTVRSADHTTTFLGEPSLDQSLELKVRCRMSMSLMYDCVWRWREYMQYQSNSGNGDAVSGLDVNHPTTLDGGNSVTLATVNTLNQGLAPRPGAMDPLLSSTMPIHRDINNSLLANSEEYFDTLSWFLDMPGDLASSGLMIGDQNFAT